MVSDVRHSSLELIVVAVRPADRNLEWVFLVIQSIVYQGDHG